MKRLLNTIVRLMSRGSFVRRWLPVLVGLILGALLLAAFVSNRKTPHRSESKITPVPVRVVEAAASPFRLEARGHGVAQPAETWQAFANVAGQVVARHVNFEGGAILQKGERLLALDPSRYELAIAEAESELAMLAAERPQLETEESNTKRLLDLERQRLVVAERELSRMESLADTNAVSSSQLDEERRSTLIQRQAVAAMENTLALLPARRELLEARYQRAETRLAQARRDWEDTRFVAPYDLRMAKVFVDLHQFVGVGQPLFEADSLDAAEIEAHIPISMMRRLAAVLAPGEASPGFLDLGNRMDLSALQAEVEMVAAPGAVWEGRVTRIASGLDPVTRTVRVVVEVAQPYRDARPPERPPLQRDVYTRVRLSLASPESLIAVPASAVHGGELYLVDAEGRLVRRAVEVAFEQGDLAVIATGLSPGERVVVDDLPTALPGMRLAPQRDQSLEAEIAVEASGEPL